MKIRRRTLAKIGLFLLAGAVVNVGVAWGLSFISPGQGPVIDEQAVLEWPASVPSSWPAPDYRGTRDTWWQTADAAETVVYREGDYTLYRAVRWRVGFPMRSVGGTMIFEVERVSGTYNAVFVDEKGVARLSFLNHETILPYAINAVGYIVNSVLYSALIAAGFLGAMRLVRSRRRARNLCPRCKYETCDLDACPECGAAIRRKAATS